MVYFFQAGVLLSIKNALFGWCWLFCREIAPFLVYFYRALVMGWCTRIDKYEVCAVPLIRRREQYSCFSCENFLWLCSKRSASVSFVFAMNICVCNLICACSRNRIWICILRGSLKREAVVGGEWSGVSCALRMWPFGRSSHSRPFIIRFPTRLFFLICQLGGNSSAIFLSHREILAFCWAVSPS